MSAPPEDLIERRIPFANEIDNRTAGAEPGSR